MVARPPTSPPPTTSVAAQTPEAQSNTSQRLVAAAGFLVAQEGIAAASARAIAAQADTSASAINYNFGNLERLLHAVVEQGVEDTGVWLADREREIAALPHSPDGAAWALLHVLGAWTSDARPLALTYQEAVTAWPGQGPSAAWTRLWRDFWIRTAQRFELSALDGRMLHAFFEHEALYHLSCWSTALEGAALVEMVERLATICLGAPTRPPRGAVATAERAVGARPHGSVPPAAMRIAKAAGEVVEEKGLAGLTHRAVAKHAGVTTGSVTHHFRSIEDLVAGAIRGQVQAMTEEATPQAAINEVATPDALFAALRFHVTADAPSSAVVRRRRLFLAALRRPELAAAGAVIRFSYGGTLRDSLGRTFALSDADLLGNASVLARLLASIWFACAGDDDPVTSRTILFDRIEAKARASLALSLGG